MSTYTILSGNSEPFKGAHLPVGNERRAIVEKHSKTRRSFILNGHWKPASCVKFLERRGLKHNMSATHYTKIGEDFKSPVIERAVDLNC